MEKAGARGRHVAGLCIVLVCILWACCPCAFALNPALDVNRYAHTSWKINEGFFKGAIYSIAQTPDGYLWLGTDFGLLRFDGVRGAPWQPPPGQHLPSDSIRSLLVARDGKLWIGTTKGLASWKDGRLTLHVELAGSVIFRLLEDHEGVIWVGAGGVPAGKLCAIHDAGVQCYGDDGSLGIGVIGLAEDSKGNLWLGVENGLWRWKPGPPKFYSLPGEADRIQSFAEDTDGTLLIGTQNGIRRFIDGKTEAHSLLGATGQFWAKRLFYDRDGSLWIGTFERGILHLHEGRTDVFAPSDGLTGEDVYTFFEDREGNIWVSTNNGLDRFRDSAVTTLPVNQGLSNLVVRSVLAAKDGSIWLSTRGGLDRWSDGQITQYGRLLELPTEPGAGGNRPEGRSKLPSANSLFQDDRGRIWVSPYGGLSYLENNRFVSINAVPQGNVTSMAQDSLGNLWIVKEQTGLLQVSNGSVVQQIPWARLGRKDLGTTIVADSLHGGFWVGFFQSGVAYFADGQVRASYSVADGLGAGRINHLRLDKDSILWAATEGGLSRLANGRVSTLTASNGLPCNVVHWTMEDDFNSIWLYTACGLVRVARSELDAWSVDSKRKIQATVFDSSDGVKILATGGHYSPQVAKSTDGKLWFVSGETVSVLDPRYLSFNKLPPPVHIEQFIADRKTYDAISDTNGRLRLPPLIRDLQIDYTALSLVAPEKILFRYKLENHDRDWQDVGNRRQAFYNNLPPGNYRFRVMACNNSGVWNEAGTFLDFSIEPAYYQTMWFRVSCVAALLIVLAALYQLRLRQVARQVRVRMEERLEERERIARDLHDTLLQSVQGLILKFHAGIKQIPRDMPAYDVLEKTLDHADEVLAEGRDRVRNLRTAPIPFGGLPAAFKSLVEETPQADDVTFKTVVEGSVRELHPMVSEECYCIGREAIVNALTHSGGHNVEVEITYDSRQFRLRVRDNGRGFDPKILEKGGRPNHWGLQGMRERADKIGAQLKLWSRQATGTEVELIVPGATAYQAPHNKSKGFRLRRSSSSTGE
jgi:ligand-binding sensor domain-containing protein/signal transduction histidine kinase